MSGNFYGILCMMRNLINFAYHKTTVIKNREKVTFSDLFPNI